MITDRSPATVLAMLCLIALGRRLDILNPVDAALWFGTGISILVAMLTRASGQQGAPTTPVLSPPPEPPPPPAPDRDARPSTVVDPLTPPPGSPLSR